MAISNRTGSTLDLETTVVGLQGHPVSGATPQAGQALVFNGTDWTPETLPAGGASVGSTPPPSPGEGDLWFDTGNNTLNVWNGSAWVPVSSTAPPTIPIGDTLPSSPGPGELWWDTTTAKLFLWDGEQWVITINTPSGGGEMTGPIPFAFIFPGAQWPQMQVNVPIVVAVTVPEDLVGSVYYNGENATATTNTFQLNQIRDGSSAQIGLVTVATDGTAIFTGSGGDLEPGDILQMVYPSTTGDPTLADVGITILTQRQ